MRVVATCLSRRPRRVVGVSEYGSIWKSGPPKEGGSSGDIMPGNPCLSQLEIKLVES